MSTSIASFLEAAKLGLDLSEFRAETRSNAGLYHSGKRDCRESVKAPVVEVTLDELVRSPESFCSRCFHNLKISGMRAETWKVRITQVLDVHQGGLAAIDSFDTFTEHLEFERLVTQFSVHSAFQAWIKKLDVVLSERSKLDLMQGPLLDEVHTKLLETLFEAPYALRNIESLDEPLKAYNAFKDEQIKLILERPGWSLVHSFDWARNSLAAQWAWKLYKLNSFLVMVPNAVLPFYADYKSGGTLPLEKKLPADVAEALGVFYQPYSDSPYSSLTKALEAARRV